MQVKRIDDIQWAFGKYSFKNAIAMRNRNCLELSTQYRYDRLAIDEKVAIRVDEWYIQYHYTIFFSDLIQPSTMLRSLLASNRKETHWFYLDFHVGSIKTLDVILWINSRLGLIFSYNLLLLCPKLAHIRAMRISFHCTPNKKIDLIKSSNFSRRLSVQQFDLRFFPILDAI